MTSHPRGWLALGLVACLLIMIGAGLWSMGLMDSMFAYRSPLRNMPPAAGTRLGVTLTRRVVFVLVDALRADTAAKPDVMPFLAELRARGATATVHSRPPSYSETAYSVLFTGAWPNLSDGPVLNLDYAEIPTWTQDDLVSAAHRAGLRTGVSGYNWFERLIPQAGVSAHFYTPLEDAAADRQVVDAALPWLRDGSYQLVFIHLDQVDYAGHHEGGPRDPRWNAAARRADDLLREIAAPLDFAQDTLLVVSDHGQIDRGGHGGTEPITLVEPWVLVGAGVVPGSYGDVDQTDVAPTLAALLGTNIPASAQGRVRTEMLALSQGQRAAIGQAEAAQQESLAGAYGRAIGQPVQIGEGSGGAVEATQAAIAAARADRLGAERLPRILIAAVIAILPALFFIWRRSRVVAWLLAGAVLYMVLFNLSYAVISARTYSLSSVAGSGDLISFVAITAALAFILAWAAVAWRLGLFRRTPSSAATLTAGSALVTLYLLSLPVLLSYALNGLLVTWTLPEFVSMFLALLSGIQALVVGALGMLLAGVAGVGVRLLTRGHAHSIG